MKFFPFRSKRAAETKRQVIDFADLLEQDDQLASSPTAAEKTTGHLTISSVESVTPEALDADATTAGTRRTLVTMLIAGGNAGADYAVDITAETEEGQTLIRRFTFRVN